MSKITDFFDKYKSAKELRQLAMLQMKEDGHIPNLNEFLGKVQQITKLPLPDVPENATEVGTTAFRAYENSALSAAIGSLSNWLTNPENLKWADRQIQQGKKIKKEYEKEINEIRDKLKEIEKAKQKKEEEEQEKEKKKEEQKTKAEEKKDPSDDEIRKQVEEEIPSHYKTLGIPRNATREQIEEAYQEKIKDMSQMSKEEAQEVEVAYHTLINERYKSTYDKQLNFQIKKTSEEVKSDLKVAQEAVKTTIDSGPKIDPSWKYVISFHPNLTPDSADWSDMNDQMKQANYNVNAFRNDNDLVGFITFDSKEIAKFKKNKLIPSSFTEEEANSVLNISRMVWIRGGTATDFLKSIENNTEIDPSKLEFFKSIALNIAAMEQSDPTLSDNLHLSAGRPSLSIEKPNKDNVENNDFRQIAIELKDNVLVPIIKRIKSLTTDTIKNFMVRSLESKAAVKFAKLAEKIGTKAAIEKLRGALETLLPGAGKLLISFLNLFGGLVDKALIWLKKFVEENKEAIALVGILGAVLIGLGLTALGVAIVAVSAGLLLLSGGLTVAAGGAVGAITFGIPLIIASIPIVSIIVWTLLIVLGFTLLTIFTLFIINSGGYVIPQYTYLPFGATCTNTKLHVDFPNNTSSSIARRAWEITDDLYQGFWCFWNRSPGDLPSDVTEHPPSYPELFDYPLYLINPNPPRSAVENDENSLFWCTQLVYHAYQETGNSIGGGYNSSNMLLWFKSRGRFYMNANSVYTITTKFPQYLSPRTASLSDVVDGSVIFFFVHGGPDRVNHVALVHHKECSGSIVGQVCSIYFVQANAGDKQGTISYTTLTGIQNLSDEIEVIGFGKP